MKKFGILFIALVGFAVTSNAQITATGTATARIVTPLTLTPVDPLAFGLVGATPAGGTVTLPADGTARTFSGVTLPASAIAHSPASFDVVGDASATYTIELPSSSVTLTGISTSAIMTVDAWHTELSPELAGNLNVSGKQTFHVGATLNVGTSQPADVYSGTFVVKVDYN